jgi:hypothetical protein
MNPINPVKLEKLRRRGRNQGRCLPKRLRILKKSYYLRRWFLRNPWIRPVCVFNYAAIKLQAFVRGFLIRKNWNSIVKARKQGSILSNQRSFSPSRKQLTPKKLIPTSSLNKKVSSKQLDRYLNYLDKSRKRQSYSSSYHPPTWLNGGFSSWSAVRIQSWWRMISSNKRLLLRRRLINQVAAIVIQTTWRNFHYYIIAKSSSIQPSLEVISPSSKPNDLLSLLKRITNCWRRYCNRRIYYYFRNMIFFKLQGAPVDLLRTIIPNEADLFDRASGVHVKFRLGGKIFPPKIYFKVFTHRPLCDINAFAPRDYSNEKPLNDLYINNKSSVLMQTQQKPQNKHSIIAKRGNIRIGVKYFNTLLTTTNPEGLVNWYQRNDNNNWRPVSSLLIEKHIESPPIWFEEEEEKRKELERLKKCSFKHHTYYHFSKDIRKQDLTSYRRKRRNEWMLKLYTGKEGEVGGGKGQIQQENSEEKEQRKPQEIFRSSINNSFLENLEYKSQIFYENENRLGYDKSLNIQQMINVETNEKIPFIAPAKGKYSVTEPERKVTGEEKDYSQKKKPFLITSDSESTVGDFKAENNPRMKHEEKLKKDFTKVDLMNQNDQLLEWSLQIDYDDYIKDWNMIGTSLPSDILPKSIY